MTEPEKIAFLEAVGRETANVILAELRKIEGATTGDLLVAMESVVTYMLVPFDLARGQEGAILKKMRERVMWRLGHRRVFEAKAAGSA